MDEPENVDERVWEPLMKKEKGGIRNITARLTHPHTIPPSQTAPQEASVCFNTISNKIHLINYATALQFASNILFNKPFVTIALCLWLPRITAAKTTIIESKRGEL